jgi:hypothetical protein
MTIPRNLFNLALSAGSAGVLGAAYGLKTTQTVLLAV